MSNPGHNPELIYQLNDRLPLPQAFFSALSQPVVTKTLMSGSWL
jgi:hypothetical protein